MNELIKKFHNQAIEELDPNTVVGSFSEAVVQRVAELIVRECASMAESFHRHQYDFTGNLELHEFIKAHFGVEE